MCKPFTFYAATPAHKNKQIMTKAPQEMTSFLKHGYFETHPANIHDTQGR